MKLSSTALTTASLLVGASAPLTANAWSLGGPPGLIVNPSGRLMFNTMGPEEILRRRQAYFNQAMKHVSPRYEVVDDEKELSISLDVPGVRPEDIDVVLEEDGKILSIKGHRENKDGKGRYSSRFSQSFTLDPTVDPDKFTAKLDNGVLIVKAPKDLQRIEMNIRRIPIATAVTKDVATDAPIESAEVSTEGETNQEALEE